VESKKDFYLLSSLTENGHRNTITDVKWSPQCGREYNQIASCSLDRTIIVWRVDLIYDVNSNSDNTSLTYQRLFCYNATKEVRLNYY